MKGSYSKLGSEIPPRKPPRPAFDRLWTTLGPMNVHNQAWSRVPVNREYE